jgi:hypothetical protein
MTDERELDAMILSEVKTHWLKVARIVAMVSRIFEDKNCPISEEMVADRIARLVQENRLKSKGDLSLWRFSEVRLPTSSD